jgi:spore coat polysaccharide biosynthesis predicted glycosyltransferase SpsG
LAGKKILCLSNPMGLGHVTRDLAVILELRKRLPSVEAEWLTASPNTIVLKEAGEVLHPASGNYLSVADAAEKIAQPGFKYDTKIGYEQTIAVAQRNAEVLAKVLMGNKPDLVYGDESLEVLFLLLKYPKLKQWPLVWLTDSMTGSARPEDMRLFVQSVQAFKSQNLGPVAMLYVGTEEDIPDRPLGAGLPTVRAFFNEFFKAVGYILPFNSSFLRREGKAQLKSRLGFAPDKKLVVASIGGTGIGLELLERVAEAAPEMTKASEGKLEIVLVCGPRLSPERLHVTSTNVQVRGYVPHLYEHFAAADFAIIEGGLTSAVELAAVGTPFVFVPLKGHVEQEMEVAPRLERLQIGTQMSFDELTPKNLSRAYTEVLKSSYKTREAKLPIKGAEVTAEIIQKFL